MNTLRNLIYLFATVLTAMMSVSCTQSYGNDTDDPGFEEGVPTEVRITLSARSCNGTRASDFPNPDGTPKDPVSSIELMHNWWIVFVDQKGNVKVIEDDDIPLADKIRSTPSSVASPEHGFEAETFKTILPSGTYRIYAFANIKPKSETEFKGYLKQDKDGKWMHKTLHLIDFIEDGKISGEDMQWPDTENIPMTGVMTNKIIKNTVEEAFNVEVIRAVAKVEFAFSNSTTETITLKTLDFRPISKYNKISFVPNNDSVGFGPNNKLITDKVETGSLSFNLNSALTVANPSYKWVFYCNESLPHDKGKYEENEEEYKSKPFTDLYTQHFEIDLTVEKNGTEKTNTFQTSKITYINRNDWIYIPIKFNDWVIKWKLHTYPPIGGYPAVFNQSGDGETLTATMTTGGEFELYPETITQNGDPYTVDWTKGVTLTYTDPKNLFLVAPSLKDNAANQFTPINSNKVIAGELDPKKEGTAAIRINFYLIDKDNKTLAEEKTCLFTIIRKNSAP